MHPVYVRMRLETSQKLRDLAREDGVSVGEMLDRLVEETRRTRMMARANEAYAAIAADPVADASWRAEIAAWDVTVGDGLPVEPGPWDERSPHSRSDG